MGLSDKAKNAAQDALGKAKEAAGNAKDDDSPADRTPRQHLGTAPGRRRR